MPLHFGPTQVTRQSEADLIDERIRKLIKQRPNGDLQLRTAGGLGGGGATPNPPPQTPANGLVTTSYYADVVPGAAPGEEDWLTAAASFTIGLPGSGADVELTLNLGPAVTEWTVARVVSGLWTVHLEVPGHTGTPPYDDTGTRPWSWRHAGVGDPRDTIQITKPAGAVVPGPLGDVVPAFRLAITRPL